MTVSETILKVAGVSKRFGGLQALSDVGIHIERGQVYGLIGPNGAGKTTFFNVLTGLYTPDSGTFELAGKPYTPNAVHEVAKAGIARTFQNIRLFAEMTAWKTSWWAVTFVPGQAFSAPYCARPASGRKRPRLQSAPTNCLTMWVSENTPTSRRAP